MSPVRTVFLGTPDFAAQILDSLLASQQVQVAAVFTQPDRFGGRGKKRLEPPVKKLASQHGIPVFQPERLDRGSVEELQRIGPDALTVAAYGQILPAEILNVANLGAINVHASLLPRYRGAAPIQWALLNGDSVTGVTTMRMEQGMDSGPILEQRALAIGVEDTAGTLHDELAQMGASLLLSTLTRLAAGNLVPVAQDPDQISYAPKLGKEVRRIDWNQSAQKIHNTIRALHPSPGAYCYLRKSADDALLRVRLFPGEPGEEEARAGPGEVLGLDSRQRLGFACRDRAYWISSVQPESGQPLAARDFYNGYLA